MRSDDKNVSLYDMENLFYNEWKSRQDVKRREDSYKKYIASSPLAKQIDEALKQVINKEI